MTFDRIVEAQIRRAMEEGAFSNLPGSGKPINWPDPNPYAGGWQLAFDMLGNAGMAPRWIELEAGVRHQVRSARELLALAWRRSSGRGAAWEFACSRFRQRIRRVNQAIRLRNLIAPPGARGPAELSAEAEIAGLHRQAPPG